MAGKRRLFPLRVVVVVVVAAAMGMVVATNVDFFVAGSVLGEDGKKLSAMASSTIDIGKLHRFILSFSSFSLSLSLSLSHTVRLSACRLSRNTLAHLLYHHHHHHHHRHHQFHFDCTKR